ncbi:MAG: oligosaccharide flippase family protein [Bryobacterales bacterium]|nr:oligosaccharide flippase family protein [Bryobacterales bacterium]
MFKTILRNAAANWAGYFIVSVTGFLLSPIVAGTLGQSGYGMWTLVLSLTGYCGLLDLGIRSAVGRFVARYAARQDAEGVNRTMASALVILLCGSAAALLATAGLYWRFDSFQVDEALRAQGRLALLIAGVNVSLALPAGAFGALLTSLERYDVTSAISVGGALLRAALAVYVLRGGYGIVGLALVVLGVSVCEYLAAYGAARRLYPPLRLLTRVTRGSLAELYSFGIFRFVSTFANQLIFYTDAVVIGYFLTAAASAPYAIAVSVITYGRTLVTLAADTIYPSAVRLDSLEDRAGQRRLLLQGMQMTLLIGVPLCLGYLFLGRQFIGLWMGRDYELASSAVLTVLTLPLVTSFAHYPATLILAGMARHRILAYVSLAEGVANLLLSVLLVQRYGAIGVAWATVVPHLVTTLLVIPAYTIRTLGMDGRDYFGAMTRPVLCGLPIAALCYGLGQRYESASAWLFVGEVGLVALCHGAVAYALVLSAAQRAALQARVRVALNWEPVRA